MLCCPHCKKPIGLGLYHCPHCRKILYGEKKCFNIKEMFNIKEDGLSKDNIIGMCAITIGFLLFIIVGFITSLADTHYLKERKSKEFQTRAIDSGYAQYTTDSGIFVWIDYKAGYVFEGEKK